MTYRLGIDIGGTKINVGLIRFDGEDISVIAHQRLSVRSLTDIVKELGATAAALCRKNGVDKSKIELCGVGIPGTVSRDGRRILIAPNLASLDENLADALSAQLHLPVSLIQDSRAAAWGEYLFGGGKGFHSVLCFTLGTGIGTGMVLDGKIYHGALGTSGELGHVPAVPNGRPCGCGKQGCLEKYCAGGGLDITAAELLGQGNTARELFEAARCESKTAREAVKNAVSLLGNAIVAAVNLLSPDCVLFSGGLCEEGDFIEPLIAYIQSAAYSFGEGPVLKKATLGTLAPMIGAALINA